MFTKFRNLNLGLLVLRLGLAYIFLTDVYSKFTHIPMTVNFFSRLGLPYPHEFVYFIAIVELIGGLSMLLGAFTEIGGLLLVADMIGVISTVRSGPMAHGLLAGHNYEFMLLLMALAIVFTGAGQYALIRPKRQQTLV